MDEVNAAFGMSDVWVPLRRDDLSPEALRQVSETLEQVPELPVSFQKIIQLASDPDSESKDIAEAASSDPVLVSHILMMVNSSYYGLSRKIDNLRLAIVLLGFNEVRNIAIRSGLSQALARLGGSAVDTRGLWAHSYLVSLCAESLAGTDDPQRAGVALTIGMMHDIGKFALYAIGVMMRSKGIPPARIAAPDACLMEKEEALFGVNHAVAGGLLAGRWNLSERMRQAIECHHHPSFFGAGEIPAESVEDVATVCIADIMANRALSPERRIRPPHPYFFEVLGLDPEMPLTAPPDVMEKFEYVRGIMNGSA